MAKDSFTALFGALRGNSLACKTSLLPRPQIIIPFSPSQALRTEIYDGEGSGKSCIMRLEDQKTKELQLLGLGFSPSYVLEQCKGKGSLIVSGRCLPYICKEPLSSWLLQILFIN